MKYRFAVETVFIKEIEIEAENEDSAYDKAYEAAYDVEYTPADEGGYSREITLIEE